MAPVASETYAGGAPAIVLGIGVEWACTDTAARSTERPE
jgi:hypothetical protein